jgi:hypothetical protein
MPYLVEYRLLHDPSNWHYDHGRFDTAKAANRAIDRQRKRYPKVIAWRVTRTDLAPTQEESS